MSEDNEPYNGGGLSQARAQLESVMRLVGALGDQNTISDEDAIDRIWEDPLSVDVRSGWSSDSTQFKSEEYRLLLCTGGPAVRITGELGEDNEVISAHIEYQDCGTPWTELFPLTEEEQSALLTYAQQFYYGE